MASHRGLRRRLAAALVMKGGRQMSHSRRLVAAIAVALTTVALAACSGSQSRGSSDQQVDDAAITAQVKTALLKDQSLGDLAIAVETHQNVVQLTGIVDSPQRAERAQEVASNVDGVRSVRNELKVK
jgi:hyperosmotically inducible protein